jgi:NAD(P)H-quinone oxidoreductase subunit 5
LIAVPPLGGFWAFLQLGDSLFTSHPKLFALLLVVNALASFSLFRVFGLVFGGQAKEMAQRSPEAHWPMLFPMILLMGVTLHVPLLLGTWQLLPEWVSLNPTVASSLVLSSAIGGGAAAYLYLSNQVEKPIRFGSKALQDFFAYDLYTQKLYRVTIVFLVDLISRTISWVDRYIVDGLVNLVAFMTVSSGQGLKYNVSGQTQFYALTILLGVALLGFLLSLPILSRLSLIVGG